MHHWKHNLVESFVNDDSNFLYLANLRAQEQLDAALYSSIDDNIGSVESEQEEDDMNELSCDVELCHQRDTVWKDQDRLDKHRYIQFHTDQ